MFKALTQMFAVFFTIFRAADRIALACDEMADWSHRSAEHLNNKAKLERAAEISRIKAQLAEQGLTPGAAQIDI